MLDSENEIEAIRGKERDMDFDMDLIRTFWYLEMKTKLD
jgi:hypothetical protein